MNESKFTKEIYQQLIDAVDQLPNEAIEKADKETTRKGYDTTGYQYQFLVNVLNTVVGPNGWTLSYQTSKETEGKWGTGKSYWDVTIDMTVEILGAKRTAPGGHRSEAHYDAKKGAMTNALKKTLALFGVGTKAYEGTLDDDYKPLPPVDKPVRKVATAKQTQEQTYEPFSDNMNACSVCGKSAKPPFTKCYTCNQASKK